MLDHRQNKNKTKKLDKQCVKRGKIRCLWKPVPLPPNYAFDYKSLWLIYTPPLPLKNNSHKYFTPSQHSKNIQTSNYISFLLCIICIMGL